jgi:fatty acid desaturase
VQLLALASCFVTVRRVGSWWTLGLLAGGFGVLMNSVYSIIHEAEHGMLFPNRFSVAGN